MVAGDISVDVDYTPALYDRLWDEHNRRPHTWFMFVYDPEGDLAYPPFVFRRIDGDERGLTIGGPGILWALGSNGIGPVIVEREYLSGADMLSNGTFALDDLYWRRPSEGSLWVAESGTATNAGGLPKDDVFEYDFNFPARPGNEYVATATGVFGTGSMRIRILFAGRFNPPNLLDNGDLEDGPGEGWTETDNIEITSQQVRNGSYSLRIGAIPKPQLISNGNFADGADDWTLGSTFSILTGGLIAFPNEQPQYITDPHFETLAGWSDVFTPAPMSDDIDIISDGAHARSGVGVMRVGPVTQHQVLANADFGSGFDNWFASSTDAEPDWTWWDIDPTEGNNGTPCARTIGWSTAGAMSGPLIKYLRADSTIGGVDPAPYDVVPGESYRLEGYVKFAPGSEGRVYLSLHFPHPTVPGHDTWILTDDIEGVEHADMRWNVLSRDFTVPANRPLMDVLCEVHDQGLGYTYFDTVTVTRTQGNRAQINYDTPFAVVADTRYEMSALVRSGDLNTGGSFRMGVILTGSGVDPQVVDTDKGSTDFEWSRVAFEFRPPTGYDTATPFVAGMDILGDPYWVDVMEVTKIENNSDECTHDPFAVVADQRYLLSADVTSIGATRGTIAVGVTLSGAGVPDQDFEVTPSTLDDLKVKAVSIEVRPPPGYDTATPYVRSTDVEGGVFAIDNIKLTKVDNNSDSATGTVMAVIPERTYRWTQPVFFAQQVERGNVRLGVRCVRAGHADETFYSSPMDKGEAGGTWQTLTFDFTPPSGYDQAYPIVVGTDVEGGYIYLDDGEVRDADTSTAGVDVVSTNPLAASPSVTATAPDGTESVRVAVILESGASAFTVGAVSLVRTDKAPATGDQIVADMLVSPKTGDPLCIVAGDIDCPERLLADWHLANLTNREALAHYATVTSDPPREYRVTATDPPRLDCKEASALFVDHTPDHPTSPVVLVDAHIKDPDVEDMDPPEVDATDRPSEVKVLGADRQLVGGGTMLISATGDVPGDVELDLNGRPMERTQLVSAGTVDHEGYARAYADDLADAAASPPLAVSVTLNEIDDDTAALLGIDARPAYDTGDWIYVYKPTAGLIDVANETTINGEPVFPRRVRVLERERSHGPGYTVTMVSPLGETFELAGINYDADRTALTVGDRLPDWVVDPQGKAEGVQYLKDRASRPR